MSLSGNLVWKLLWNVRIALPWNPGTWGVCLQIHRQDRDTACLSSSWYPRISYEDEDRGLTWAVSHLMFKQLPTNCKAKRLNRRQWPRGCKCLDLETQNKNYSSELVAKRGPGSGISNTITKRPAVLEREHTQRLYWNWQKSPKETLLHKSRQFCPKRWQLLCHPPGHVGHVRCDYVAEMSSLISFQRISSDLYSIRDYWLLY